jgi:FkbM family methyltransferase
MSHFSLDLLKGVQYRFKTMFYRPYSVFNIGWLKEKILKHDTSTNLKFHLYKNKYKIAFTDGSTFLMSIHELFVKEFYKFKTDAKRPRIIDCGSYIGTSLLYFKVNYPNSVVTGFEPDDANYLLLNMNLKNWNFADLTVQNAAIWTNNDSVSFESEGNMSSRITEGSNAPSDKLVKCVRLRDLLDEPVDFLKIDIEGAELEVLRDCSDKLHNVKNLFVEYHGKYDSVNKLNEILDILVKNNFKYYIKEGSCIYENPLWEKDKIMLYDLLLNIFAYRD